MLTETEYQKEFNILMKGICEVLEVAQCNSTVIKLIKKKLYDFSDKVYDNFC